MLKWENSNPNAFWAVRERLWSRPTAKQTGVSGMFFTASTPTSYGFKAEVS